MGNHVDDLLKKAQQDLSFDRDDLDSAWSEQAMHYAKYSHTLYELEATAAELKNKLDTLFAKCYAAEKREFLMDGVKPTESMILNKIKVDPAYLFTKSAADKSRNEADFCKNILEAFRQKRDMIVQASKREIFDQEKLGESSFIGRKK